MTNLLPQLICAHLIGDFILQNHEMARDKAKNSLTCFYHVSVYLFPFIFIPVGGWTWSCLILEIGVQHFLQDRFQLHLKWMKLYEQTPPEQWPTGPLCVDQAWHIAFLWLFSTLV